MSKYQSITTRLIQMAKEDQNMRKSFVEGGFDEKLYDKEVDVRNTVKLKEIIEDIGWPTISKVGEQAAQAAWMVAQHTPDKQFQKDCLGLMEENLNDVSKTDFAFLKDRVLIKEGKKQLYGTQYIPNPDTGGQTLHPVEDPTNLNKRRAAMGLDPL